jgi:hypothetical protein
MGFCAVDRSALVWGRWVWPRRPDNRSPAHRWADLRSAGIRYWIYCDGTAFSSRTCVFRSRISRSFPLFISSPFSLPAIRRMRFLIDRHVHKCYASRPSVMIYVYIYIYDVGTRRITYIRGIHGHHCIHALVYNIIGTYMRINCAFCASGVYRQFGRNRIGCVSLGGSSPANRK